MSVSREFFIRFGVGIMLAAGLLGSPRGATIPPGTVLGAKQEFVRRMLTISKRTEPVLPWETRLNQKHWEEFLGKDAPPTISA